MSSASQGLGVGGHGAGSASHGPGSSRPSLLSERVELHSLFSVTTDESSSAHHVPDAAIDPLLPEYLFGDAPAPAPASSPAPAAPAPSAVEPRASRAPEAASRTAGLPEVGSVIDKYRIEALLGVGGFAAVYRATHLLLKRPVALKLLRTDILRKRPGLAALLCDEARLAASINHPNVVRVFDVTHTDKITYVVMEFIEGKTLAALIRERGRIPLAEVLTIGRDVASGLAAAHALGIIHRDVKPQNIMLAPDQTVKLLDLGLARSTLDTDPREAGASSSIVGTYGYMAPEQAETPTRVDHRADIFGLGATLYHALTGVPPFPRASAERREAPSMREPVVAPEAIAAGVPVELSALLLRMLARLPSDRPSACEQIAQLLSRWTVAARGGVA